MRFRSNTIIADEGGFALIATLLVLALLTFIGLMGINSTSFEVKIAGNERQANQRFYTSDSGWKQSGPYLNAMATPPNFKNTTLKTGDSSYDWAEAYYQIVRNYGDGNNGTLNDKFPANTEDGVLAGVPYWYRVRYENDFKALEFGANYRDFQYEVRSNANGEAEVVTKIRKFTGSGIKYRLGTREMSMRQRLFSQTIAAAAVILSVIVTMPVTAFSACTVVPGGTYIEAEDYTGSEGVDPRDPYDDRLYEMNDGRANGKRVLVSGDNGRVENTPSHEIKTYAVNFNTTGTYYIWARATGRDTSRDSMFFTVDNDAWKAWDLIESNNGTYSWNKELQVWPGSDDENTIEITSTGAHTIKIAMREPDSVIDGFFLTTDPNFTPTDATVPSTVTTISPKDGCTPAVFWDVQPTALGPTTFKGYNASPMTFTVTNTGEAAGGSATITSSEDWAVLSTTTIPALAVEGSQTVTVSFNTAALAAGTHTATITMTGSAQNSPLKLKSPYWSRIFPPPLPAGKSPCMRKT